MALLDKVKDFVITIVNAKLRVFNKPFLLAMLIGTFQLIILVVVFATLSGQCVRKQVVTGGGWNMLYEMSQINTNYCIIEAWTIHAGYAESRVCYLNDNAPLCNDDVSTMSSGGAKEANAALAKDPKGHESPRCPFTLNQKCYDLAKDGEGSAECVPEVMCPTNYPYCTEVAANDEAFGQMVLYNECPGFFVTVGVTLGYAGFIEFGFTVFIIGILWKCGIVNTEDSSMEKWMKGIINKNAGAVVAETQVQLEQNDVVPI